MEYGEKIRLLREEKNLSQQDLANMLGVNKQMISDVERGKQKRFNQLIESRLKELFGVDFSKRESIEKMASDSFNINNIKKIQEDLLLYYFSTLDDKARDRAFIEILKIIETYRKV